ncbi:response regulator [Crateriforma conspicua]|uniref:Regulatory protein LuxO n=1 Tax=Crateriforma conspicua TaxID=2527996 RepID=A0A5C6FUN8_9PLAN|nr:response regulator [Crateriforma conspicua]TWU65265.1 Regulatory protein LuxO [Crateriforma conspicua]
MPRVFKILVVDDSPTQQLLLRGVLEQEPDLEVESCGNGQEALVIVMQSPPDLVLTDLQMPEMDGLELTEAVKQAAPSVPVILTTGQGSEDIAAQALRKGAASYVPKRSMNSDLLPTLRQVLQLAESETGRSDVSDYVTSASVSLSLRNDETLVPGVIARLEQPLIELDLFDEGSRMQISMALDEALLNAMIHGNLEVSSKLRELEDGEAYREMIDRRTKEPPFCDRRVRVEMAANKESVRFVIRDEGNGFDVASLPDPTDPANLENVSGRGLLLINAFMDSVSHNDVGNELIMVKRCDQNGSDSSDESDD